MSLAVLGAGAFGTALAIALSQDGSSVTLWGRDANEIENMRRNRRTGRHLQGHTLPDSLVVSSRLTDLTADVCLLAVPTQQLAALLDRLEIPDCALVACCKGVDRETSLGPVETIKANRPDSIAAALTGPSFAADIVLGLPTALVLATQNDVEGQSLQAQLTRPALRLYRTTDVTGAELGGALKNVVALAAGIAIGAGLGDSARASVVARGFSEMVRFAQAKGARPETLHGLSGLGDLVLTCTSEKSRNFSTGVLLGQGQPPKATTVEGLATAGAVVAEADRVGLELPLMKAVADVVAGTLDIEAAIATLLARPVGKE